MKIDYYKLFIDKVMPELNALGSMYKNVNDLLSSQEDRFRIIREIVDIKLRVLDVCLSMYVDDVDDVDVNIGVLNKSDISKTSEIGAYCNDRVSAIKQCSTTMEPVPEYDKGQLSAFYEISNRFCK